MNVNMVRNGFHFVNPQTVQSLGQPTSDIQPFLARRGPIKSHSDHEPNSIPVRNEFDRAARFNQLPQAVKIILNLRGLIDEAIGESKAVARMVVVFIGELPAALRARPMTGHGWGRAIFWTPGRARAWPLLLTRWRRLAGVRASSMKRNNSRRCVGFNARNASSAPRVFSSSRRISEGTLT